MASVYSDASLAEKELNWKAQRGLDEMCKLRFSIVEEVLGAIMNLHGIYQSLDAW